SAGTAAIKRQCYALVPRIDLPDLLAEVNDWTHMLDQFTHLQRDVPLTSRAAHPLLAAIMGTGLNMHRASCLLLLSAAIAAWNTVYLTQAVERLRAEGMLISDTLLAHLSPLG
ncbi:MAG: Tn3 family transposase, partial [Roseiflexaceae bacterium]|nr:Tn3 family transposase [Roseiflexaceae bacterium]